MSITLPRLVIVSGSSASGKSSIARAIAAKLEVPLLAKDDIKEALFDSLGNPRDEAESHRLGNASYLIIERIGLRMLDSGVGLVVEGNFWRERSELTLGPMVARSRAVIVHCKIAPEAMVERIKKRVSGKKPRHPGHLDNDAESELLKDLDDPKKFAANRPDVEPPNLDLPVYTLDTTEDHNPSVGPIVKWIRKETTA